MSKNSRLQEFFILIILTKMSPLHPIMINFLISFYFKNNRIYRYASISRYFHASYLIIIGRKKNLILLTEHLHPKHECGDFYYPIKINYFYFYFLIKIIFYFNQVLPFFNLLGFF
jgi:hypothetical protein